MDIYIKPTAAFRKPESAKTAKQNVYIYGATGFGKTELVKQFLQNDKYIYIPCFRNSCDLSAVPENNKRTVTVVIDNVNAVESDELRNEIKALCSRSAR